MAKPHSFPTLYDDVLRVKISKLKEWGYIGSKTFKSGTITWSSRGIETASISITVNMRADNPYLELDYKYKEKPRNYTIELIAVPSNLGKGNVWYFLCPKTNKRCRILYLVDGYFLHREAFTGCMYEKQTYSSKNRQLCRAFEKAFGSDRLYDQLYSKYFKKYYAGKPTKRYLKLMEKIQQSEEYNQEGLEKIYLL